MTETQGRQWLMKLLKNEPIKLQPIESHATCSGISDLWFTMQGSEGWIELKQLSNKELEKDFIEIPWRPNQLQWMCSNLSHGSHIYLFVFVGKTMPEASLFVFKDSKIRKIYHRSSFFDGADYANGLKYISPNWIIQVLGALPPV